MTNQRSIDTPSISNRFGWERIGNEEFAIPVILRSNNIRYSPVRIVEQEIIKKYEALPPAVFLCITLKSYYLTSAEAKLLNNINFNHCNNRYGEAFFSTKDVIISAQDVKDLSRFLNVSHAIFSNDLSKVSNNFGVIVVAINSNDENETILVPYITKSYQNRPQRFIPSSLVDSFISKSQLSVSGMPNTWDIMYLKMLCIYCENSLQQKIGSETKLILLDGLKYNGTSKLIVYNDFRPTTSPKK